jgi:predicted  nucleic acid-binding Zn-ribbon protein
MTEKAGEVVRATGTYRCERCHKTTHFTADDMFSTCPHCGYDTFDLANRRFETPDGRPAPHEPEPDGT